jgi:hypothetical protein
LTGTAAEKLGVLNTFGLAGASGLLATAVIGVLRMRKSAKKSAGGESALS